MFRWFRRQLAAPRLAGQTAGEWYVLHRSSYKLDTTVWDLLAQAVLEITSREGSGTTPTCLIDVLVTDATEVARCVAAIQLSTDPSPEAETALIAALQDESELVRRTAAESLFRLGSVRGLAAVVGGSRHGHAVRTHAAFKLANLNSGEAKEALPALMVLLQYQDINWRTHLAAVAALKKIGDAAIPALVNGLHKGSPQMRKYAAIALKEMGKTPDLLPMIDEVIRKAGLSGIDEDSEMIGH
ncbi:MAG: HEAT repeat domain-containing protein [Zavarzinella sp.]